MITGICDLDQPRWPNSYRRSVKVGLDESTAGERQPRVLRSESVEKMQAEKQGFLTLEEWRRGLKALQADTLIKLQQALPELENEVQKPANHVNFYTYAFEYCLTEDRQKSIDVECICQLLELVLGSKFHRQIKSFVSYLKTQVDYKVINMDQGTTFYRFCNEIPEDPHFVLRMRYTFESLGYQSGFYLSQLFTFTRGNISSPSSTTMPLKQPTIPTRPPPLFNWAPLRTMPSSNFHNPGRLGQPPGPSKDEPHMFLHPHSSEPQMENMMGYEHVQNDIKWPNEMSFFSALKGRSDDARLLFNDGI